MSRRVLAAAAPARGFRLREERVKKERTVHHKGPLPFLPGRDQVEVVIEKHAVREDVEIDPAVTETGFVTKGSLVARVRPGKQGKEGKSVFGRLVQAPRPAAEGMLFLAGLTRTGAEVKAEETGFLRKGAGWCDVVPFRDHAVDLAASPDRLTCLLSFTPGDAASPEPDPEEILTRARKLGFDDTALIPAEELGAILKDSITRKAPLMARSITPVVNGLALLTVSEDKLKAVLTLRKGRGGGRPLTPAAATDAIRTSRVRGFNAETVRRDLRAFFDGPDTELAEYVVVEGKPPKQGSDPKVAWRALFLPTEEAEKVKAAARANKADLGALTSLEAFPVERVEAVARVKAEAQVLVIIPSTGGVPGLDVFGASIPPGTGKAPDVRLYEGLVLKRDTVVTTAAGILEKGSDGMAILLRVRSHKDAELHVTVATDRMKAALTFLPAEGDGARITEEEARARMRKAGVQKGIIDQDLAKALESIKRGDPLVDVVIAEGRPPRKDTTSRINFHVRLATGRAVSLRADGRADFRAQDRITRVRKGERVATVRPRDPLAEDGWDVTGLVIPLPPDLQESLEAGKGMRADLQSDGSIRYTAESGGELIRDGNLLSVVEAHTVTGDVDMSTGNVDFPGVVRIGGTVRSGFSVVAGSVLEIAASVEGALLSSAGSVTIGQGIKGEGRAVVRSKRDIESLFAEQAALLAIGNVHLHGPCVRCQVKCNGKLLLDSEKGNLVGGEVRASPGRGAAESRRRRRDPHGHELRPGFPREGPDRAHGPRRRGPHGEGGRARGREGAAGGGRGGHLRRAAARAGKGARGQAGRPEAPGAAQAPAHRAA